jgi:class 3 adenylate cyclase/tetratricopeptide (TPR) repeat protein
MKCPRCQHENEAGAKFCEECAAALARTCRNCGRQLSATAKFCPECAHPASRAALAPTAQRFISPESYTPKHLAEKILTSKGALEGERKQVTVLFADLKGSMELLADRDPEEARQILDPVLERMMEAVHRYEGTVNQVMGDGIMALFGAPLAHEDHAVRACYAALRMQEAVTRHAEELRRREGVLPQIRVGLNSGAVVVRSIGNDLRMDYTAVGQTTHLAARMEQMAAAGSILLAADTLRLVEGYVQVKPLGAVTVKGLAEPIEVFELTGAGTARTRLQVAALRGLTRFVGRDAEVEHLRRVLDRAGAGHGQVVAIVGEAGVGKSRLTYEFTHSHRVRDWLILETSSVSYGKATSYLPVIDLLKGYFKIQERDDPREIRAKVTGKLLTLDESLKPTLPALLGLLDVPVDDTSWHMLDARQRRQRTLEAVKRLLLREAREQPLVLIFEDLHWIDAETQALLDSLVESLPAASLLLLASYRPEYQHRWGSKTYYRELRIDPLPADSADDLLTSVLGTDPSLDALKRLLIALTEGNPLFLEESVRALVETKALVGGRGTFRLALDTTAIQLPATVQAILAARIDRLAPEDKRLLQEAAVIGKDVPYALLLAVAELDDEDLRRALVHLQAAEFLYETRLFPDLEYTFKHALTLEVAYQSLVRERRCALHGRVLQALEQQWAGREQEKIEVLAHHAERGELWDRAARYLYQAGERAYAQARYQAGLSFYQAAVEALDQLGDAADLTLKLDACLELWSTRSVTGRYDGVRELSEKAEALARALDDGPRLAQVRLRQAQAVSLDGVIPGTMESGLEKAREAFERADPADLRTRSYARFIMGNASRDLGRVTEAVREFAAGLSLFEPAKGYGAEPGFVYPIYVSLSAWRAEAYAALGDFPQAILSAEEALRVANDIQHPTSLAVANRHLGYVHSLRGQMETAVSFLERALAIGREHDLFLATIWASSHLAYALVLLGKRERGLEYLAQAIQRSSGITTPRWHHYGTVTASAYLAAGCREEARAEIREGLAAAAERNAWGRRATWRRLEAEVLTPDDPVGARERLEEALALSTELGIRPEAAHCHLGLGKLYRRTGKREQAQEHLTTATTMYREMGMTYWLEQAETEMKERS